MDYPVNPYNKESQPLSHYLQEHKNWGTFFDNAFAPINDAYAPKQQPVPGLPFSTPQTASRRPAGPLMTREEVAALMAAPLTPAQRAHIAEADARVAAMERAEERKAAIWIAVFVVVALLVVLRWH
jgi:hypothetical protein